MNPLLKTFGSRQPTDVADKRGWHRLSISWQMVYCSNFGTDRLTDWTTEIGKRKCLQEGLESSGWVLTVSGIWIQVPSPASNRPRAILNFDFVTVLYLTPARSRTTSQSQSEQIQWSSMADTGRPVPRRVCARARTPTFQLSDPESPLGSTMAVVTASTWCQIVFDVYYKQLLEAWTSFRWQNGIIRFAEEQNTAYR